MKVKEILSKSNEYKNKDIWQFESEEALFSFLEDVGIEVEESKSKLEEAREYKVKFHDDIDNKIYLYEQAIEELINKMKCCGNCKSQDNHTCNKRANGEVCADYDKWELDE